MKRYLLLTLTIISVSYTNAQTPEDALRNSWFVPNGSARYMATGGVMGSLGGDITAAHVNPAGLGLFKTNEFVFSPNFNLNRNKFNFRGTDTSNTRNAVAYGTSGWVFGIPHERGSKWASSAFSISINQLASFNNKTSYKGTNNYSSFSEQYLEELTRDGANSYAAENNYTNGASLAWWTWLIDSVNNASGQLIGFQTRVPANINLSQQKDVTSRGGFHEIALGFASNMEDKLYLGGSLTVPFVIYSRDITYREADMSGITTNDFNYFEYKQKFNSLGIGLGAKLGFIYKPREYWRLGFAIHTPQFMSFKDKMRAWMTSDTEGFKGVVSQSSDYLRDNKPIDGEYNVITPWKAIASASYVFREVSDTRKQRAFLSADVEYVNYRGSRYFTNNEEAEPTLKDYYKEVNRAIKASYKGNFNFRVGGELKLHTWMFRLGGAYYGSPYKEKQLKADRVLATGGLGYRNKGFFIDLSYAHMFMKDVDFPYLLNDKANTFATQNGTKGNVALTVGFKF